MTMHRSQASNGRSAIALLLLAAVLFFGTGMFPWVQSAFVRFFFNASTDARYASLSRADLEARLKDAEEKLERIGYQSALFDFVTEENTQLKNASVVSLSKTIPARVISRPPRTLYDNLLVDQGVVAGIHENDLVVFDGVALGSVVSVGPNSATVALFSTPGIEEDVLLGEPQAIAVAKGMGGGSFELLLPQNVVVTPGESVRLPHSETLLFGVVVSSVSKPSDATQVVYVKSPISLWQLDYVSVIPRSENL